LVSKYNPSTSIAVENRTRTAKVVKLGNFITSKLTIETPELTTSLRELPELRYELIKLQQIFP